MKKVILKPKAETISEFGTIPTWCMQCSKITSKQKDSFYKWLVSFANKLKEQ